jgi:EAL domain-containing protein (putative c-di-GMP-specific phosphodiesterase class I)/GGDEF domain-containing protein
MNLTVFPDQEGGSMKNALTNDLWLAGVRLYRNPWTSSLVIVACGFLSWLIVYETGGTKFAHLHTIYFPIVLASFRFHIVGGIIAGMVATIVMGPLMPLDVAAAEAQESYNWLSRGAYLCLFGAMIGFLHDSILTGRNELYQILNYDPVTNLPLFEAFRRKIGDASNGTIDPDTQHVILNFEILTATDIRKSFGNEACEDFIKACADRIQSTLPEQSYLARGGHATFLAFIEDVGPTQASHISDKIVSSFQSPVMMQGLPMRIESRVGMVVFPDNGTNPDELVRKSFSAISQSLVRHNEASIFNENDDQIRRENLRLLADLGHAIQTDGLLFFAQPKICAQTGLVRGCELLVRWQHPEQGMIPPDRFIPLAEKSRLISDITKASIEAARHYMIATESILPDIDYHVAINVSGWDVSNPEFPKQLLEIFKDELWRLAYLELEITETAVIEDLSEAKPVLEELRRMGLHIAIDDFGTGFSSFSYLKDFPADTLKIDQSFVFEVIKSSTDATLVSRTIELSCDLGMKSVAEGVEDKDIADWLRERGCDLLQGYWIAKPMPFAEWSQWLSANDPRAQESPSQQRKIPKDETHASP